MWQSLLMFHDMPSSWRVASGLTRAQLAPQLKLNMQHKPIISCIIGKPQEDISLMFFFKFGNPPEPVSPPSIW